jgi:hypothetical protein
MKYFYKIKEKLKSSKKKKKKKEDRRKYCVAMGCRALMTL